MLLGEERREFGRYLRQLRQRKNLTLRELAQKSTVPFPNISAIECGRLGAGRMVATKLAVGLSLRGRERKNFVTFAAYTNSRDRLAKEYLVTARAVCVERCQYGSKGRGWPRGHPLTRPYWQETGGGQNRSRRS